MKNHGSIVTESDDVIHAKIRQKDLEALSELFKSLMPDDLKQFSEVYYPELSEHVHWKEPLADTAHNFTRRLKDHGLINEELFINLLTERPQRKADIVRAMMSWHTQTAPTRALHEPDKSREQQKKTSRSRSKLTEFAAVVVLFGMGFALGYLAAGVQPKPVEVKRASLATTLEISAVVMRMLGRAEETPGGAAFRAIINLLPEREELRDKLSERSLSGIANLVVTSPKGLPVDKNLREARKMLMEAAWKYGETLSFERIGIVIAGAYMLESEQGSKEASAFYRRINESLAIYGTPPANLKWINVTGGSFNMGCPLRANCNTIEIGEVQTKVESFKMLKHEVTLEMVTPFIKEKRRDPDWASKYTEMSRRAGQMPLVGVNWFEATALAYWLNGRLPTEKEWEYAARAGVKTIKHYGHDSARIKLYEWVAGTTSSAQPVCTSPRIREFQGGFCDMHGNVYEWTSDWWRPYQSNESDPLSIDLQTGRRQARALRGGSWITKPRESRSTSRDGKPPRESGYSVGFRIVRDFKRSP